MLLAYFCMRLNTRLRCHRGLAHAIIQQATGESELTSAVKMTLYRPAENAWQQFKEVYIYK